MNLLIYKDLRKFADKNLVTAMSIWILLWLCCAGGTIYLLPLIGANQYSRFYITSAYFLFCALLNAYVYRINDVFPHHERFSKQFPLIVAQSVAIIGLGLFIDTIYPISAETEAKIFSSEFLFPLFRYQVLITKFFDISFQQMMIFAILKKMKRMNISDSDCIKNFTFGFFMIHLPLVFSLKLYAFYFIVPSFFAGILFSYVILKYRYGLVKSFAIHYVFYLLIGLFLRY